VTEYLAFVWYCYQYDLGADISERFNRLQAYPEIAEHLVNEAQHFYDELRINLRPAGKRGH